MLQLEAEKATKAIAHPNEMLKFVPTIVYNHVSNFLSFDMQLILALTVY